MGPFVAIVGLILAWPGAGDGAAGGTPAPRVEVRIVPTKIGEKIGRAIELWRPEQHFYVVVTNVSDEPVRLWREWCSWGYFNLSFVVTDGAGEEVRVTKRPRGWDKNFPDDSIVPPGGHAVFEVSFDESVWQDAPLPEAGKSRAVRMRAVYEVKEDDESVKHGVWTGSVSSPDETYTIYR
jgi:hypothetical protein